MELVIPLVGGSSPISHPNFFNLKSNRQFGFSGLICLIIIPINIWIVVLCDGRLSPTLSI